jgi:hypothetical protein
MLLKNNTSNMELEFSNGMMEPSTKGAGRWAKLMD